MLLDRRDRLNQLGEGTRQAIELPNDQHVALAGDIEDTGELGSVDFCSRCFLGEDAIALRFLERDALKLGVLLDGRDAGISYAHAVQQT